ncbi:MAG: CCA tRNA nucleotidyltransferase [Pseudorhodoplanes sp.]|nr:CCA tRNA nucleotidyltransferase [Pseudorhodoplanes sp.]
MSVTRLERSDWLQAGPLKSLLAVLDSEGEEARVVGGAVRNALLGETPHEFDVATTALPEEVIRRAQGAGFKPIPTGIEHGTVTVVVHDRPFEVTTLREDVETFGRKARVAFGRDWKKDAQRRDFTINALSVTRDGVVHDEVGGLDDLKARRVRFIGEASARIAEDYLRILRFFRFHAHYGEGALDRDGLAACIAARSGLDSLSRERVRAELLKLLLARHCVPVLAVMSEAGLLITLLGGVPHLASLGNLIKLEATMALEADALRRLGALAVYVAEDADRLAVRLRLSNAEASRLAATDGWWRMSPDMSAAARRVALYRLRPQTYLDRSLLAWARSPEGAADTRWRELASLPERWTAPVFPLKGADFIARGVARGPVLGQVLGRAEAAWIAADFPDDAAALDAIAAQAVRDAAT